MKGKALHDLRFIALIFYKLKKIRLFPRFFQLLFECVRKEGG